MSRRSATSVIAGTIMTMMMCSAVFAENKTLSAFKDDEQVHLFNVAGSQDPTSGDWRVPVHGWVGEPEDSHLRRAFVEQLLQATYGLSVTEEHRANFNMRVNAFLADNERGKRYGIALGDSILPLPASAPDGHFRGEMVLARSAIRHNHIVGLDLVDSSEQHLTFPAVARLVAPAGLSVISDIDDTIKITEVRDRRQMLERSLLADYEAVPGMAALYRAWAEQGVALHFVSSSPWQLYPFLAAFTEQAGFPWATFSLKQVRVKDETILDLFKPGTETKPAQIEPLLARFPARRFVLVGDNGEQDPEVYAGILARHPEQIVRIYIRNVAGESQADARYQNLFGALDPSLWRLFDDPATLTLPELDSQQRSED